MNIDISSDSIAQSLEINARYDLQALYVRVRYGEFTNNYSGATSPCKSLLPTNIPIHFAFRRTAGRLRGS